MQAYIKELSLDWLPDLIRHENADLSDIGHDQQLLAQARDARLRGDHWQAQQLASAAHQWATTRAAHLHQLAHAQALVSLAKKRLEAAWDHDRSCATVDELRIRHPEYRQAIHLWETAEQRVRELTEVGRPKMAKSATTDSETETRG